jgi:hypothetical protein
MDPQHGGSISGRFSLLRVLSAVKSTVRHRSSVAEHQRRASGIVGLVVFPVPVEQGIDLSPCIKRLCRESRRRELVAPVLFGRRRHSRCGGRQNISASSLPHPAAESRAALWDRRSCPDRRRGAPGESRRRPNPIRLYTTRAAIYFDARGIDHKTVHSMGDSHRCSQNPSRPAS